MKTLVLFEMASHMYQYNGIIYINKMCRKMCLWNKTSFVSRGNIFIL